MLYLAYNGPFQTTASPAKVTTGTGLKTMLQIKPFNAMRIVEWGCSFDGSAAATPGVVELVEVDVAATVTAFVDADITKYEAVADVAVPSIAGFTLGVSASGYTASAEGTPTASRNLDAPQLIAPTNQFIKQLPLGKQSMIQIGKFARIRVNFAVAVNMLCYILVDV